MVVAATDLPTVHNVTTPTEDLILAAKAEIDEGESDGAIDRIGNGAVAPEGQGAVHPSSFVWSSTTHSNQAKDQTTTNTSHTNAVTATVT
mmetsp:Transcript_19020/g.25805  ORF Transcript_19020/g.25805 Transcript_19020/m.25805 type:complete len:90 (+) Transcript_19020:61-330(+)